MFGYCATGRNASGRQAEHGDENIDHRSEARMINKEMREFHGSAKPRL